MFATNENGVPGLKHENQSGHLHSRIGGLMPERHARLRLLIYFILQLNSGVKSFCCLAAHAQLS
jgi:hypothetical protein